MTKHISYGVAIGGLVAGFGDQLGFAAGGQRIGGFLLALGLAVAMFVVGVTTKKSASK